MFENTQRSVRDAWVLLRQGVELQQLTGVLKGNGPRVAITYLGPKGLREQCTAFLEGPAEWRLGHLLHPDLLVVAEPLPLPRPDVLRYAPFLDAVLDVAPTLEAQIEAVHSKAHRRRLRKASFGDEWRWTVTEGPAELERFYRTLHRPYVEARFGEQSHPVPLAELQRRLAHGGGVLTVTQKGEPVCGALLFRTPDGLDYDRNGFRLDSLQSPVRLAERTAALEVAIFQRAHQVSARTIFFGFCRALVDDGLFTHKRRLGCRFVPARATGRSQLWVRPALRPQFFSAVPLVMGPCGQFDVHIGLSHQSLPLTRNQWRARLKNFAMPAVRRAVVWTDLPAQDVLRVGFEKLLRAALGPREVEVRESAGEAPLEVQVG
jgi:hypothetical protein